MHFNYLYIFLFLSSFLKAQNYDIPVSVNLDYVDGRYLYSSGIDENGRLFIPVTEKEFDTKVDFQLYDFNFIDAEKSEISDNILIDDELKYSIEWFQINSRYRAYVSITPILKINGKYKLLSSFRLKSVLKQEGIPQKKEALNTLFSDNSVLSEDAWVKLRIHKSGVYKIDYDLIKDIAAELSINDDEINPRNIAVFGQRGGMLPEKNSDYNSDDLREFSIEVKGGQDGVFNEDDYVLFYAEGANSRTYSTAGKLVSENTNVYTDYTYVFINLNKAGAKRITTAEQPEDAENYTVDYFHDYKKHETEEYNLIQSGQQWFGERLDLYPQLQLQFDFPDRDIAKELIVNSSFVSRALSTTQINISANNQSLYSFSFPKNSDYSQSIKDVSQIIGGNKNITLDISHSNEGEGTSYLDFIEINAISKLNVRNKQFGFRNFDVAESDGVVRYLINTSADFEELWNISDPFNPKYQSYNDFAGGISFKEDANELQQYWVLTSDDFYSPELVHKVENQNLHALPSYDYIIVSEKSLLDQAEKLANYHRSNGLRVYVADVEQIYNEFSAGRQDLIAIRQFVRMIYKRAAPDSGLKYLLMFGDASYDFKDRISSNTNVVPAYQSWASLSKSSSFVSDDYFGFMDDDEGDKITSNDMLDIAVGRIPVNTKEEAEAVVNKIIGYKSVNSFGEWRNRVQFVADDVEKGLWEVKLLTDSEKLSASLEERNPDYNHQKVYIDTYVMQKTSGGNYSEEAHSNLMYNVQNGNLITNYFGHGNETSWTGEGLFSIENISDFRNNNNLPLFITVTCEFSRYDNPNIYTGGEELLLFEKGGGIGLISTTREITVSFGSRINESILEYLLPAKGEQNVSVGEALRLAKNDYPAYRTRRTVSLIGDPALKLAYPSRDIAISELNYRELAGSDTIKALMKVNVKGEVRNMGVKDESFNGVLYSQVYDKVQNFKTLDNNNFGVKLDYWIQNKVVYKGKASVDNGIFDFEFVVPKDINYAFGESKFSFYAQNDLSDASGANKNIVIGSVDTNSEPDNVGPEMELYLNNIFFRDGGVTNSSPKFIAEIFDASGLNTVGNGIGHDLTLVLMNDGEEKRINVNEFYTSELNDYKNGKLEYQFIGLDEGEYSVELTAWDVFNNSTKSKLNFYVREDDANFITELYNFPNPLRDETYFRFSHNSAGTELDVIIEIYSVQGKLLKTINEKIFSDGFVNDGIRWDARSENGAPLPSGTYIYKLKTVTESGLISNTEVNKLIIIR